MEVRGFDQHPACLRAPWLDDARRVMRFAAVRHTRAAARPAEEQQAEPGQRGRWGG